MFSSRGKSLYKRPGDAKLILDQWPASLGTPGFSIKIPYSAEGVMVGFCTQSLKVRGKYFVQFQFLCPVGQVEGSDIPGLARKYNQKFSLSTWCSFHTKSLPVIFGLSYIGSLTTRLRICLVMDVRRWKIFRGVDPSLMSKCKLAKFVDCQKVGFLVLQNEDVYVVTDKDSVSRGYFYEGAAVSEVSKVESLCGKGTVDFYGTKRGFAALTQDGCVYTWIDSEPKGPDPLSVPTRVSFSDVSSCQVSQLTHGSLHFLCLTSDGEVFCWTANNRRLLGSMSGVENGGNLRKVPGFSGSIVQVAAGAFTSYALDSLGRVWSWGSDDSLGYEASGPQLTPKLIDNLFNIKKLAAGCCHVVALSATGELYFWGHFDNKILPTKRSEITEPIIDVGAIMDSHTVVFQTKDKVYLWGVWNRSRISIPLVTKFTSIDEAFACSESPWMLQPIAMNVQPRRIEEAWKRAFDDPFTSDIIFSVGNQKLHAHALFLKLRSEYFRLMFANDWGERRKKDSGLCPIEIHGFSFRVFKAFIYFLYHESLIDPNMSVEDLAELMRAADYYRDDDLRCACENKLRSHLTPENACFVYTCAVQSNAQKLQDYTAEFIGVAYKEVVKSAEFVKMDNDCKTKLMIHFADLNMFQVSKKRRLQ